MPASNPTTPPHISINEDEARGHDGEMSPSARSSSGWDGKLRVEKGKVVLANPDAISDPEYSDEENVKQGEEIEADEGNLSFPIHTKNS